MRALSSRPFCPCEGRPGKPVVIIRSVQVHGQKFQNVKNALGEAFTASLESAKWKLWHGNVDDALTKLALLRDNVSEETQRSKWHCLQIRLFVGIVVDN